ncbi:43670_t:CDS:2, partial [Gigaspora margarita]
YAEFSIDDIVIFTGKFIIKNLEQFIIASHITVIAAGDPGQEYEADKILLNHNSFTNTKCVIMKLRFLYPTHAPCFTYIYSNNSIKPGWTFLISGFIRYITSESIAVEATDIDFIYASNDNIAHNMHDSPSMTVSGHCSDFDMIIDEIESQVLQISQALKKDHKLTTSSYSLHSMTFMYNLNKSVTSNSDLSPSIETTQLPKEPNDEASDLKKQKLAKKPAKKQKQAKKRKGTR